MFRAIRLLLVLTILLLAGIGVYTLLGSGGQGGPLGSVTTFVTALAPVSRGEIVAQFKIITVEREYNIPVVGSAYKSMPGPDRDGAVGAVSRVLFGGRERVPGTTEQIVYEMVTSVTAGVDLARLSEADIRNSDVETTITLPRPEVFAVVTDFERSGVRYRNAPSMPFMSHSAQLISDLQKAGLKKHRREAERDAELMAQARKEAARALGGLLESTHPGRKIVIGFADDAATTATGRAARAERR